MVHFAVLFWLKKYNLVDYFEITTQVDSLINLLIRFLIVLFFTVIISYATFTWVEKPFMNLGKRIILKLNGDAVN